MMSTENITRPTCKPPIAWYGGKTMLTQWILPVLESYPHTLYLEPFGGSGAVLMAKKPGCDIYNDKHAHVVNLYRVLQNPTSFLEFQRRVALTPYSREMFYESKQRLNEAGLTEIDHAVHFFIVVRMSVFAGGETWNVMSHRERGSMPEGVAKYLSAVDLLAKVHQRLQTVQIENRNAIDCIRNYACESSLIYCDPPYPFSTRKPGKRYEYEMDDSQHEELISTLLEVPGHKVISTYPNPMYEKLSHHGWSKTYKSTVCKTISAKTMSYQDKQRMECLYCSPNLNRTLFSFFSPF